MALSPQEELELLQLEEEEHQQSLQKTPSAREQAERVAASPENIEIMKAFGAGALRGGTLGLSEEIGATGDVISDYLSKNATAKRWREYQQQREAANKQLAEKHPYAFAGGEVAGGIGGLALVPAAAPAKILGGAGKLVGLSGELSPRIAAFLAGKTPEAYEAAQLLKEGKITTEAFEKALETGAGLKGIVGKALGETISYAPHGAIYGAGTSEHYIGESGSSLQDVGELAKAAGKGILDTSTAALGVGIGGASVKKAGEVAKKIPFFRKAMESAAMGAEGYSSITEEGKRELNRLKNESAPGEVSTGIKNLIGWAENNIDKALKESKEQINVDTQFNPIISRLSDYFNKNTLDAAFIPEKQKQNFYKLLEPVVDEETGEITKYIPKQLGNLSAIEANEIKKTLYDVAKSMPEKSAVSETFNSLGRTLTQELNKVPAYQKANETYSKVLRKFPEMLEQPMISEEARTASYTSREPSERAKKIEETVGGVMRGAALPGSPPQDVTKTAFDKLSRAVDWISEYSPEGLKELGKQMSLGPEVPITATRIKQRMQQLADRSAIASEIQGHDPRAETLGAIKGAINTGLSKTYSGALKFGAAKESLYNKPVNKLMEMSDNQLRIAANKLRRLKLGHFADNIEKALNSPDPEAKNRLIFTLSQDPNAKEAITAIQGGVVGLPGKAKDIITGKEEDLE